MDHHGNTSYLVELSEEEYQVRLIGPRGAAEG
jgi:hypothetical protein